jgi:hypothetical protein
MEGRVDDGMVVWEEDEDDEFADIMLAMRESQAGELRDNLENSEEGAPDFEAM